MLDSNKNKLMVELVGASILAWLLIQQYTTTVCMGYKILSGFPVLLTTTTVHGLKTLIILLRISLLN